MLLAVDCSTTRDGLLVHSNQNSSPLYAAAAAAATTTTTTTTTTPAAAAAAATTTTTTTTTPTLYVMRVAQGQPAYFSLPRTANSGVGS